MNTTTPHIIWAPARGLPTKIHASYEDALAEAKRLAAKHPETDFYVFVQTVTVRGKVDITVSCPRLAENLSAPSTSPAPPKPKIAEGYNPDGLTEEQVGVADGWRLLTVAEKASLPEGALDAWTCSEKGVSWWGKYHELWFSGKADYLRNDSFIYRTKHPAGHFLRAAFPRSPAPLDLTKLPVGTKLIRRDGNFAEVIRLDDRSSSPLVVQVKKTSGYPSYEYWVQKGGRVCYLYDSNDDVVAVYPEGGE